MNVTRIALGLALVWLLAFSVAHAQSGAVPCQESCSGAPSVGTPYWGWYGPWVYVRDYLPYYAVHPPVYYSYPVPRPYGYSPYAYPPGVMTPHVVFSPEPLTVPNPYVPQKTSAAETSKLTATPHRITNPYVAASGDDNAPFRLTARTPVPQRVYPAGGDAGAR